jgi:hypothetical protein
LVLAVQEILPLEVLVQLVQTLFFLPLHQRVVVVVAH